MMNILSCIFTALLALVLPVAAAFWLAARRRGYLKPVLLGTATFILFQVLTRIPLLQLVLPQMAWYTVMTATQPLPAALFMGVTAALFEEGGRYLVMRLFMHDRLRFGDGLAFGIGHGGIEAILFAGLNALLALLFSSGSVDASLVFAGGLERLFAMTLHIAWSLMVLRSVRDQSLWPLLLAFVLHTAADTGVVLAQAYGFTVFALEGLLGLFALSMLTCILFEYKKSKGVLQ